jgi:hypothetical protein
VTLSVTVSFDLGQLSATYSFTPGTAGRGQQLARLCGLLHDVQHNVFVNPLWDPNRDLVAQPLSVGNIREMSRVAREVSDRTQAVLRDMERGNVG